MPDTSLTPAPGPRRFPLGKWRRAHQKDDDRLTPLMKAIKAVHSATSSASTNPEDLEKQRAGQELFGKLVTPALGLRTDPLTLRHGPVPVPAEWVRLDAGHDRNHAVLYCHGGGYTCGQLGYARVLASKLALATGFDVLSFEYRLSPEHPYPAAVQDALGAWDTLAYLGYGARDIFVAGDSAGGNLALELALRLKEQGRRQPRGLLLFSPWTDMTAAGASYAERADADPLLTHEYVESVRAAYCGSRTDFASPCFSPLYGDLRGLPPTLIQIGSNEILFSDSERLHAALQRQGVFSVLEEYPDCWHVFQQMPTRAAAQAMDSAGRFVRRVV